MPSSHFQQVMTLRSKISTAKVLDSHHPFLYHHAMPNKPAIPAAPIRNGHMPPDNHMPAIVIALITFFPLGLVALHHSRRVERCWQANNREGAHRASRTAWKWCVRTLFVPVLLFMLFLTYWGWVALEHRYRVDTENMRMWELLHSGRSEDGKSRE